MKKIIFLALLSGLMNISVNAQKSLSSNDGGVNVKVNNTKQLKKSNPKVVDSKKDRKIAIKKQYSSMNAEERKIYKKKVKNSANKDVNILHTPNTKKVEKLNRKHAVNK